MTKKEETIIVRGIAAALQAMVMPTFKNLADMLSQYGYLLTQTKHTNNGTEKSNKY